MLRSQPGPGPLLQAALDPLVVIGTLAGALSFFGAEFNGACLILALLVFAMTFPGGLVKADARRGEHSGDLILDIVTGWLAVAVLLLMLGWATRTLDAFDQRAILAWLVATPFALIAAHRVRAGDHGDAEVQDPEPGVRLIRQTAFPGRRRAAAPR